MLQVYGDTLLSPVHAQEVRADFLDEREILARWIPPFGVFDLNHLGPQIGQEHRTKRSGQSPGHIQDSYIFQRTGHKYLSFKRF
jgi:hypothetical protein